MTLFDIELRADKNLVGMKKAVMIGKRKIVCSPAMYDLISNAETQEELKFLMQNIRLIQIPEYDPSLAMSIPMVSQFDGPKVV